eukprot:9473822-Pyramimonas_sp.AAC.1
MPHKARRKPPGQEIRHTTVTAQTRASREHLLTQPDHQSERMWTDKLASSIRLTLRPKLWPPERMDIQGQGRGSTTRG